ncbi:MAG: hypothetical protein J6336_10460 [Kiritimatiellae bacterium]|nr:hypothetical protein [Kiritimatiellia bacterium]
MDNLKFWFALVALPIARILRKEFLPQLSFHSGFYLLMMDYSMTFAIYIILNIIFGISCWGVHFARQSILSHSTDGTPVEINNSDCNRTKITPHKKIKDQMRLYISFFIIFTGWFYGTLQADKMGFGGFILGCTVGIGAASTFISLLKKIFSTKNTKNEEIAKEDEK